MYSINSFTGFMSGPGTVPIIEASRVRALFPSTFDMAGRVAADAKERSASYGELRALWPRER